MRAKRAKAEIRTRIRKKAEEKGYEYFKLQPHQMLLIANEVYDEIPYDDEDRHVLVSALLSVRSTIFDNHKMKSIMQGFMEIYKYSKLAKELSDIEIINRRFSIDDFTEVFQKVYETNDEEQVYAMLWYLYSIGLIEGFCIMNRKHYANICKGFKKIATYLAQ